MASYPINTGSIVEVQLVGKLQGQTIRTIMHYKLEAPSTIPDGDSALQGLNNIINTGIFPALTVDYMSVMPADYQPAFVQLQWIFPTRYVYERYSWFVLTPGFTDPLNTANAAVVIQRRNFITSRHGRGQLHLPACPPTKWNGGQIDPGTVGNYNSLLVDLKTTLSAAGGLLYHPIMYDRKNPTASQTVDQTQLAVTIRTERRRTVGRGE